MSSEEIQTMEVDSMDQDNKGKFSVRHWRNGWKNPGEGTREGASRYWCVYMKKTKTKQNKQV